MQWPGLPGHCSSRVSGAYLSPARHALGGNYRGWMMADISLATPRRPVVRRQSRRGRDPGGARPAPRHRQPGSALTVLGPAPRPGPPTSPRWTSPTPCSSAAASHADRPPPTWSARGASVVPVFSEVPYPDHPEPALYTPEDHGRPGSSTAAGGFGGDVRHAGVPAFHGPRRSAARRPRGARPALHDAGIDDALVDAMLAWQAHGATTVVGVMGGHAEPRGYAAYRDGRDLAHELARAGRLVATGGGPGVMEAANLGAFLAGRPPSELDAAIDQLATAPDFHDHERYTAAALRGPSGLPGRSRHRTPGAARRAGRTHLAVRPRAGEPVRRWHRQVLLQRASGRTPCCGWPGAGWSSRPAGRAPYRRCSRPPPRRSTAPTATSGPLVFLGRDFWTDTVPVRSLLEPLLAASPHGDLSGLIRLTDEFPRRWRCSPADDRGHGRLRVGGEPGGVLLHGVVGLDPDEAIRRLGGDLAGSEPRTFDECFWPADGPQWAQVGPGRAAACWSPSTTAGGPRRASSALSQGARVACFFRNVHAVMHFVYAVDGRVLAEFDPLLGRLAARRRPSAIAPAWTACRSGCSAAEPSALALLERLTGVRVAPAWLDAPQRRWPCRRCADRSYAVRRSCARCCCGSSPAPPGRCSSAAVRDEFLDRPWDPPAAHWPADARRRRRPGPASPAAPGSPSTPPSRRWRRCSTAYRTAAASADGSGPTPGHAAAGRADRRRWTGPFDGLRRVPSRARHRPTRSRCGRGTASRVSRAGADARATTSSSTRASTPPTTRWCRTSPRCSPPTARPGPHRRLPPRRPGAPGSTLLRGDGLPPTTRGRC